MNTTTKTIAIAAIIAVTSTGTFAEEPQQLTQGQVTDMVLEELQQRSNEAFYYQNEVQGAEEAALDRMHGRTPSAPKEYTSVTTKGDVYIKGAMELTKKQNQQTQTQQFTPAHNQADDFKIEDVPSDRWRTYTPGFIQAFVDFGDWISGLFE